MKQVIEEVKRFVKMSGFNSDDATKVAHILAEFEGSNDEDRKAMLIRLKDIYVKNYYSVKQDKKNEKNK